MTLEDAINIRKSRRSFLPTQIEPVLLDALKLSVAEYNRKENLSIDLIEDGSKAFEGLHRSYGMFKAVRTIIALKGSKDDPHLKEKLGYYGELLVLKAVSLGLGTCWVGGSFQKNNRLFNLKNKESLICVICLGYTKEQLSFKENLIRNSVHRKPKALAHFYHSDLYPLPHWFIEAIKAVQLAPSAVNRQNYKFRLENGVVRADTPNTATFDLVDLGIAKAHFSLVAKGVFDWGNNAIYRPTLL